MTAEEVIRYLSKGIKRVDAKAEIHSVLASDGGDGFLEAVSIHKNISWEESITVDPLGRSIKAPYLWDKDEMSAYIELAKASGMELLKPSERNPLLTSTFGTGLQIKDAIAKGAKTIYLGLGGSATNDGGIGIAMALGYVFTDVTGNEILPIGANLLNIHGIEGKVKEPQLEEISFFAVNDVNNPLYGINGAAHVYAKQKGASELEIKNLDLGLRHLDKKVGELLGGNAASEAGSGAAGGTAYGLNVFFNAQFISGIDFILDLAKVDMLLQQQKIDYIITGEGKIDDQTLNGKLIKGVIAKGKQFKVPVIGVCGKLDINKESIRQLGMLDIVEIGDPTKSLQFNMENATMLLEEASFNFFKEL